jgi:two-component system, OmpR family, phosphate regulon response regulator PhoB
MLLEFIAALAAGLGLLSVIFVLNHLTGRRLPRWIFPATVGLGMLGYTIWSEYTWPERAIVADSGYVEASRNEVQVWYRPWTYLWPQSNRLIAVDHRFTRRHEQAPDLVLTRVALLARWMPEFGYLVVFDCAEHARADMLAGVELREDGTLEGASWVQLEAGDPVLRTACDAREEEHGERARDAKRVLIVEDEDNIAIALDYLITREGYEHTRIATGAGAVDLIRQMRPDLVLLDVMLPEVSGYEICQNVRMDPDLKDVKILMMTARGSAMERRKGLAMGADGFISKPFELKELRAEVRRILAGGPPPDLEPAADSGRR